VKFGLNFHAGSKAEAVTRIGGAVSTPAAVDQLAIAAVNALAGDPSIIRVAIAGEEKPGVGLVSLAITVTA
jgi:hypothetical protein